MVENYSFVRYLSSKKSVDDRALNRYVWETLKDNIFRIAHSQFNVVEIGAGIGTMLERMLEWGLFSNCEAESIAYLGIDLQEENILQARKRIKEWAKEHNWHTHVNDSQIILTSSELNVQVDLLILDLFELIKEHTKEESADLLVAHAFLDLIDLGTTLPKLFRLLRPGGLFYFTLVYDGMTIFEPVLDKELETQIVALYHRSMDDREINGKPSGDSHSGRHLFSYLKQIGVELLAAGSSDWLVSAKNSIYIEDEAYFLRFIVHLIEQQLYEHPALEAGRLEWWVKERLKQIEQGELVYIAHQLDFCGRVN